MKPHMYVLNKEWQPTIVYLEEVSAGRERNYTKLSGEPLIKTAEAKEEIKEEVKEASSDNLEKATEDYKLVYGKAVPPNKKNDLERIRAKINETLTPEK